MSEGADSDKSIIGFLVVAALSTIFVISIIALILYYHSRNTKNMMQRKSSRSRGSGGKVSRQPSISRNGSFTNGSQRGSISNSNAHLAGSNSNILQQQNFISMPPMPMIAAPAGHLAQYPNNQMIGVGYGAPTMMNQPAPFNQPTANQNTTNSAIIIQLNRSGSTKSMNVQANSRRPSSNSQKGVSLDENLMLQDQPLPKLAFRPTLKSGTGQKGIFNFDGNQVSLGGEHEPKGVPQATSSIDHNEIKFMIAEASSLNASVTKNATLAISSSSMPLSIPGFLKLDYDKDFELDAGVGSGGTAVIVMARSKNTDVTTRNLNEPRVAIKYYKNIPEMTDEEIIVNFRYEVTIMSALSFFDNIAKFLGYTETPKTIVMRKYDKSLNEVIFGDTVSEPWDIFRMATDISRGLRDMHIFNIVHFDIKPANILIEYLPHKKFRCVICDFGFAMVIGTERKVVQGIDRPELGGFTSHYASPEMFKRVYLGRSVSTDLDKGIDVYAYAITIWQLMNREEVWRSCKTTAEIEARVNRGDRPKFYKETVDTFKMPDLGILIQIVKECWSQEVSERPTMNYVCEKLEKILKSQERNVEADTTLHK